MPDTPSIVIVKTMTYRGLPEEWSNKYHFSGTVPTTDAAWKTLADAICTAELAALPSSIKSSRWYGYNAGNDHAVSSGNVTDGTMTNQMGQQPTSGLRPGDVALWVRWKTPDKTSKGKPIYLRKYYHGVNTGSGTDDTNATQLTALTTLAGKLTDGSLPGGFKMCGPQGAVAGAIKVAPFAGFRQLKRTGKRPH